MNLVEFFRLCKIVYDEKKSEYEQLNAPKHYEISSGLLGISKFQSLWVLMFKHITSLIRKPNHPNNLNKIIDLVLYLYLMAEEMNRKPDADSGT